MAALIALSERERVSYDLLQGLSTVDISYAENRKKKRSQVKYMEFNFFCFFQAERTSDMSTLFCYCKLLFSRVKLR